MDKIQKALEDYHKGTLKVKSLIKIITDEGKTITFTKDNYIIIK